MRDCAVFQNRRKPKALVEFERWGRRPSIQKPEKIGRVTSNEPDQQAADPLASMSRRDIKMSNPAGNGITGERVDIAAANAGKVAINNRTDKDFAWTTKPVQA
ncbi:hypothetical protein LP421_07220 [Rhizobium sp. RCAM05350]|nr:hypothetical protein LP421_07220 [Rhizobium sp. RCAM05350]